MLAIRFGGILTGWASANSSPLDLGIGIPAVELGAVTSVGLCAHELQKGDSAFSSAPVEVQPGVIVVPPAIISQPRCGKENNEQAGQQAAKLDMRVSINYELDMNTFTSVDT